MSYYPNNYLQSSNELQRLIFEEVAKQKNNDFVYFVEGYMSCLYRQLMDEGSTRVINMTYDELLSYLNKETPTIFKKGETKIDHLKAGWIGEMYNEIQYRLKISSKDLYELLDLKTMENYFITLHTIDFEVARDKIISQLKSHSK